MNETMQTILTRRSIRAFKPDMLPRETIDAIIEAGIGDDDMEMRRKKQAAYIGERNPYFAFFAKNRRIFHGV